MSTVNMAELFAEAEASGLDVSPDLGHGTHMARIKSSGVTSSAGGDRLYFVLEEVNGAGTAVHGQNFTPNNKKSLFFWFKFLADYGVEKDFYVANPNATPEAIGKLIADQGNTYEVKIFPQKNNPEYNDFEVKLASAAAPTPAAVADAPSPGDAPKAAWEE
jgi:hypothetical protein